MVPISLRVNAKALAVGCQILYTLSPTSPLRPSSLPAPFPTSCQQHWPFCLSVYMPGLPLAQDFCTHSFLCLEVSSPRWIVSLFHSGLGLEVISYLEDPEVKKLLPTLTLYPPYCALSIFVALPTTCCIRYVLVYCLPFLDRHHGGRDCGLLTGVTTWHMIGPQWIHANPNHDPVQ